MIPERCQFCGGFAARNKQGPWAPACVGCKGTLTRWLRSGKYGPTYDKATKRRLLGARYSYQTHSWSVPGA